MLRSKCWSQESKTSLTFSKCDPVHFPSSSFACSYWLSCYEQVNQKMILTLTASIMYWSLRNSPAGNSEPVSPSENSAADDAASQKDGEYGSSVAENVSSLTIDNDASQTSQGENSEVSWEKQRSACTILVEKYLVIFQAANRKLPFRLYLKIKFPSKCKIIRFFFFFLLKFSSEYLKGKRKSL